MSHGKRTLSWRWKVLLHELGVTFARLTSLHREWVLESRSALRGMQGLSTCRPTAPRPQRSAPLHFGSSHYPTTTHLGSSTGEGGKHSKVSCLAYRSIVDARRRGADEFFHTIPHVPQLQGTPCALCGCLIRDAPQRMAVLPSQSPAWCPNKWRRPPLRVSSRLLKCVVPFWCTRL